MKEFIDWLKSSTLPSEGDEAKLLVDLVNNNYDKLISITNQNELRNYISSLADDSHRTVILKIVDASFGNWSGLKQETQVAETNAGGGRQSAVWGGFRVAPLVLVIVFAAVLTFIMIWSIVHEKFMINMSDISVARGLITFFFTLGTIGVSILMISALFVSERDGLAERFSHGKEVLTALIAILGTVVGFYFGSQSSVGGAAGVELSPLVVSDANPQAEAAVQLATIATKGRAPYRYDVNYKLGDGSERPKDMPENVSGKTTSGLIVESFTAPKSISGKEVEIDVIVTDENQNTTRLSGSRLKVK